MRVPILRLPYSATEIADITAAIAEVLQSGYLTMGSKVKAFEEAFARFAGTPWAVAVNSGTSALEMILRALDVRGKTVVVPTVTFMATPFAAIHAGARVVFVDVRTQDLSIDPVDLERKLGPDTAAVVAVHIGGVISGQFDEIERLCAQRAVPLVEDAAHAHGSMWRGRRAGSLGIAAAFSFYPTKILTTAEGGMITTLDESLLRQALTLREHGKPDHRYNVHTEVGSNWRFSEIHAVLGLLQMAKADALIAERRRLAAMYDEALRGVHGIRPLAIPASVFCAYYKYIAFLDDGIDRNRVKQTLRDEYEVSLAGEVYAEPCHSQPVFDRYPEYRVNAPTEGFPGAEYVCSRQICLPLYPGLSDDELLYTVESLQTVLKSGSRSRC